MPHGGDHTVKLAPEAKLVCFGGQDIIAMMTEPRGPPPTRPGRLAPYRRQAPLQGFADFPHHSASRQATQGVGVMVLWDRAPSGFEGVRDIPGG